jgi:diguanylate cyclase (GGDEF)-like protein
MAGPPGLMEILALVPPPAIDAVVPERTFQVLHALAVASSGVLDPTAVARIATDGARELLQVDTAALFWWQADTKQLVRLGDNDPASLDGRSHLLPDQGTTAMAFRLMKPVLIDDYPGWEFASARPVRRGLRSVASVPLIVRDSAVGALTVRTREPRSWTAADAQLLHLLAAQVAPGLEAARLHAESERRRAEAEALAELVRAGATERDLSTLISFICEQAGKLIGADYDGIALIEEDGRRTWQGMWGNCSGDWNRSTRRRGTGPLERVLRERRSVIFEIDGDDPHTMPRTHLQEGGKTVLATPLIMREHAMGALTLGWRTKVTPTAGQIRLAEALAGYAATVLDNARAYTQQQSALATAEGIAATLSQREQALRALHAIAVATGGVLDPAALGRLVVDSSCTMLGFDTAGLYWAEADRELRPVAENDNSSPSITIRPGFGAAGKAYLNGQTMLVEDYESWPENAPLFLAKGVKTVVAVPFRVEQRTLGVLVVRSYRRRSLAADDVSLLELLASQVAPAIEAARLHTESERQRIEAESLAELARQGSMEHDTERLIQLICEYGTKLTGADYAGIRLLDDTGHLSWRGMAGNQTQRWRTRAESTGRGSAGEAIRAGVTMVNRLQVASPGAPAALDPTSVRASEAGLIQLATPMIYRGGARGALVLGWRTDVEPSPDQIRVAETLAGYATVVLENARAHLALAQQALYDELTGLPNRRLFQDRLEQAMLASRRDGHPIALLLMDLDRFKDVNDTMGHLAGDALLRELGRRLRNALRTSDTVGRLGGDEFAMVLTSLRDRAGATVAATKLLDAINEPLQLRGQSLQVAGSVGIAMCPEHGEDPETLLRRADVAMYVAKRAGSGSAVYAPEMDRDRADHLALVHDLRRGVEENELVLEFQPRLEFADRAVRGVEALVRWQHPRHGLIPPAQFIPLAEQMGLIRQLSRWVLEAAFDQRRAWQTSGIDLHMAINLSMRDLHDPQLPNLLGRLSRAHQERPGWLIVEITEGAVMSDPTAARRALATLRAIGARISLDDFGTGYSSLGYLSHLSVDEIKVDRSFIRDMARDPKNLALVRATIEMGHALGATVVAEGVENAATLELLEQLGCDAAQGYHICRPLGASAIAEWLGARART